MRKILLTAFLALAFMAAASAADYRLVDRVGNVVMPVEHGTTIDLHDLTDRKYLALEVSFGPEFDYATWAEFEIIHSGRSFDYERTNRSGPVGGWWKVCPGRCYTLRTAGSVMLKAKLWWSDGEPSPAVGVIAAHSVAFRVTDSKPVIQPPAPSRTRRPTCHGDPDVCREIVGTPLWSALSGLCSSRPGANLSLGNGAYIRCP